jgi:RNA polymerase-binding transcription factor DksA
MPSKTSYKNCENCGQSVSGSVAKAAADPSVQFCCGCGRRLDKDGKCQNSVCAFFGQKPACK